MKLVKLFFEGTERWGVLNGEVVELLKAPPYGGIVKTGEIAQYEEKNLLPPCDASKIVAVGKNYYDHAVEFGEAAPEKPVLFLKPTTSLNRHGGEVVYPDASKQVDYECELALVIKKRAHLVKKEDAGEYILGYTCLNDVTARDIQKFDGQWTRGKGFDTFCPMGPYVTDEADPADGLLIRTFLNGELKQSSDTSKMMWDVPSLIEFITECMTLLPGDVVTTGTPAGIGPMQKGDTVTVEVERVGRLENTIR